MTQHQGQHIAYARVSSTVQNFARPHTTLGEVDRFFEEKQSSAQCSDRTALAELIADARAGGTVAVSSKDRLASSVVDLNQIVAELIVKDATFQFLTERTSFRAGCERKF